MFSKRTGLEKALHQIEEAVRRSGSSRVDASRAVSKLKTLLGPTADDSLRNDASSGDPRRPVDAGDLQESSDDSLGSEREEEQPAQRSVASQSQVAEESLAVDDAENPLQLLARASDLHVSPQSGNLPAPSPDSVIRSSPHIHDQDKNLAEVEKFFKSGQFNLDSGPDLDPIELGLVTSEEAESLFSL